MTTPPSNSITPWPAPPDAPVLFVGGSFDPPHRAHVEIPLAVRDSHLPKGTWLIFVPAARSPHKETSPGASSPQRLEMLRLAIQDVPNSAIWTDELDRAAADSQAPSYWIETLRRAAQLRPPHADDRTFMGADQALAFDRWRQHEEIIEIAPPIVVLRPPVGSREELFRTLDESLWASRLASVPLQQISSTDVRSGHAGPAALHPDVADYIRSHLLYQPAAEP